MMFEGVYNDSLVLADSAKIEEKPHIASYQLGETFYFGMRNELTEGRMHELSSMADKIHEPERFGIFESDLHYLQTLKLLLQATNETRHRGLFFLREVLPQIKSFNNLIDVGPGDGRLTKWVGRRFKNITLVDSKEDIMESITKQGFRKKVGLEKILGSILDLELRKDYYDLGICSHILYYIDRNAWYDAVKKVYDSLVAGGVLVIVMNGDMGKKDLIDNFSGNSLALDGLILACSSLLNADVKVCISEEVFRTKGIEPMLHIAGLHLYDANATASRKQLVEYLELHNAKPGNIFELTCGQKFILIQKR